LPCHEALVKARAAAERAVSLDEHCAEAHAALGLVLGFLDWNSAGAKMEMQKALNLNPSYSPAHCWCAGFLAEEGHEEEALEQGRLAVACDPLSVFVNAHLGWMHIQMQRFDAAIASLRRCLELDPNAALGRWLLGQASWFTGQREAALAELQRAADLSERAPMMLSSLGWALALSGQANRAREIQRELTERTVPARTRPLFLAVLHAAFGEHDLAFAALERALAERELWLPLARTMAGLTSLASDRRWLEFVSKVQAVRRASS
jgi:eukaryotic-like serine/threonine-protein kinase